MENGSAIRYGIRNLALLAGLSFVGPGEESEELKEATETPLVVALDEQVVFPIPEGFTAEEFDFLVKHIKSTLGKRIESRLLPQLTGDKEQDLDSAAIFLTTLGNEWSGVDKSSNFAKNQERLTLGGLVPSEVYEAFINQYLNPAGFQFTSTWIDEGKINFGIFPIAKAEKIRVEDLRGSHDLSVLYLDENFLKQYFPTLAEGIYTTSGSEKILIFQDVIGRDYPKKIQETADQRIENMRKYVADRTQAIVLHEATHGLMDARYRELSQQDAPFCIPVTIDYSNSIQSGFGSYSPCVRFSEISELCAVGADLGSSHSEFAPYRLAQLLTNDSPPDYELMKGNALLSSISIVEKNSPHRIVFLEALQKRESVAKSEVTFLTEELGIEGVNKVGAKLYKICGKLMDQMKVKQSGSSSN